MFARDEFFGSKDQGIGRRLLHRLRGAALADSPAGATRRDPRCQQAECFMQVLVNMGKGSQPFAAPEVGRQASKHRRIHLQKALDGARGTKDGGEESSGIVLLPRRRQPALEKAAGNLPKERMLGGNPRFREQGNRVERTESRLPSLLKARPQVSVLLQHVRANRAGGTGRRVRALLPDAGKKIDEAVSLAGQAGRRAEGLRLAAQLCLVRADASPGPGCQRLRRSEMRAMQVLNHNANH